MVLQIVLCIADIGLLIGCVGQKVGFLYHWIIMSVIFVILTVFEAIVVGMTFEPSQILIAVTIMALIDIFATLWTILVVIGAIKDIKKIRNIPF